VTVAGVPYSVRRGGGGGELLWSFSRFFFQRERGERIPRKELEREKKIDSLFFPLLP
jgi:hypothetical protein